MSNDESIVSKEGWLKIKLRTHSKWHRRFCIIDWDKAVLFIASKSDARYRDWIKLLPTIIINDCEHLNPIDSLNTTTANNTNLPINTIEIKADNGTATHLLQADSKKEFDSWLLAIRRTAFSRIGGGIFGQSLDETFRYSRDKTSSVPLIVRNCCEHLLEHGLTFVGLFRVPGKQSAVKELRDLYDRGYTVELTASYSPATISSLLKIYLQSLPEPIIPTHQFDDFLAIGSRLKYNKTGDLDRLKYLIHNSLSTMNFSILKYLCEFLKKITDHANETKMDAENLAVVFGNNLIRTSDELDLNMIKGHNYNLLPLIKILIDQSDYLFSTHSSGQSHESSEQHNESVTKSSGFSSFSSLLSSVDQPLNANARSLSMPSIHAATFSSIDSAHSSGADQSVIRQRLTQTSESIRSKSLIGRDRFNGHQSFTTCLEPSFQSADDSLEAEGDTYEIEVHSVMDLSGENDASKKPQKVQKRFASADPLLPASIVTVEESFPVQEDLPKDSPIVQPSDILVHPVSTSTLPSPVRKATKIPAKKSLVNKFGKSISNIKSSMSKALHTHTPPPPTTDNSNTIDSPSPLKTYTVSTTTDHKRKSFYDDLHETDVEKLQAEINSLKELLDAKELLLIDLTTNSRRERIYAEQQKTDLLKEIDRLKNENAQLQMQLNANRIGSTTFKLESIC